MKALIMAGGIGSRFWPLSRESKPKQYLPIISERSMLQMTYDRISSFLEIKDIFIVTAEDQVELVCQHLPELDNENIIVEPFGRNTAPCIALSCFYLKYIKNIDPSEIILVLPADHYINPVDHFINTIEKAKPYASSGKLVTFGITPSYPATGYGYIERGKLIYSEVFEIKNFTEKPDYDNAIAFLNTGNFYWNSGMFMWRIDTILSIYQLFQAEIISLLNKIKSLWTSEGYHADISAEYLKMPVIPVDKGIMEKSDSGIVIPADFSWSDVGSWKALYDLKSQNDNDNIFTSDHEALSSTGNYVCANKFVALYGVNDLVIVDTDDVLLVIEKKNSEKVRELLDKIRNRSLFDLI